MSMYSRGGATGGIGGALVVVLIIGLRVYLRMQRYDHSQQQRQQQVDIEDDEIFEPDTLEADSLAHAHEMMDLAPNVDRVGAYLHWAVRTYHEEAWAKANGAGGGATSVGYREALFDLMLARAASDGRTEESQTLQKVKVASRAAGESWWDIKKE